VLTGARPPSGIHAGRQRAFRGGGHGHGAV